LLLGLAAGFAIAVVTTPVGVSGAVFLLPIQLDLLKVPNPAVTPTNLLYNVVSTPGALVRYWRQGQRPGELARWMLAGTVPGVVLGAVVRVFVIPDVRTFRLVVAAVLLPIGVWLIVRAVRPGRRRVRPRLLAGRVGLLGGVVGVVGGLYGIGGGSLLAPILVARGVPVATVAPAALAATFVTSVVGAVTFAVLALSAGGTIAPAWVLGLACGLGGLAGGYVGARVGRRLPERALTLLLGVTAAALAVFYVVQALR
jgi:uncharacterized membrane protein YfcA